MGSTALYQRPTHNQTMIIRGPNLQSKLQPPKLAFHRMMPFRLSLPDCHHHDWLPHQRTAPNQQPNSSIIEITYSSQPKHHQRRQPAIEIATKYQHFSGAIRNRNCNTVCHPPVTRSALGSTYPSPHAAQSTDTVLPSSLQRNRGPSNSYACR